MTRRGKIARLPRALQDQLNYRLLNNQTGPEILPWLNDLPEAKALLHKSFAGQPINHVNLTNWRLGGFRDWLAHQHALAALDRFQTRGEAIDRVSQGKLGENVTLILLSRLAVALEQPLPPGRPAAQFKHLRPLIADLVALRHTLHTDQRLQIDREKFELKQKVKQLRADEAAFEEAHAHDTPRCPTEKDFRDFERAMHLFPSDNPKPTEPTEPTPPISSLKSLPQKPPSSPSAAEPPPPPSARSVLECLSAVASAKVDGSPLPLSPSSTKVAALGQAPPLSRSSTLTNPEPPPFPSSTRSEPTLLSKLP